jgi:hypothetical protein
VLGESGISVSFRCGCIKGWTTALDTRSLDLEFYTSNYISGKIACRIISEMKSFEVFSRL